MKCYLFLFFIFISAYPILGQITATTQLNQWNYTQVFSSEDYLFYGQIKFNGGAYDVENDIGIFVSDRTIIRYNGAIWLEGNENFRALTPLPSSPSYPDPKFEPLEGTQYLGNYYHLGYYFDSSFVNVMSVPVIDYANNMTWIVSERTVSGGTKECRLLRFNLYTLSRLDFTLPKFQELCGAFKAISTDEGVYYLTKQGDTSRIVYIEKSAEAPSTTTFVDLENIDGEVIEDAAIAGNRLYVLTTSSLKYLPLPLATGVLVDVDTDVFNLAKSIVYDIDTRGVREDRIFVSTTGDSTNPTRIYVYKITLGEPVFFVSLPMSPDHRGVTTSVYNPEGIWYLGTSGEGLSTNYSGIMQFDTAKTRREGLSTQDLSLNTVAIVYSKNYEFVLTLGSLAARPTISIYHAPELCLSDCFAAHGNCTGTCFGNGNCERRLCDCNTDTDANYPDFQFTWHQETWCSTRDCPNTSENGLECSGPDHGICSNDAIGSCICNDNYTGLLCEDRRCPRDCSGKGTCNNSTYVCTCNPGWTGDACELSDYLPCDMLNECSTCVENPGCIWCASSSMCYKGDRIGPSEDVECRNWFHGSCPLIYIDVINYIFTAIIALMFINNLISTLLFDTEEDSSMNTRERWYLLQRSNKSWSLVRQLQLLCLAGLIYFRFPTTFLALTRYWNWITLSFGYVWNSDIDNPVKSSRSLTSLDQYITYWRIPEQDIFFAFLIWLAVVLAIVVALFAIAIVVALIRKASVGYILKTRGIFMLLRVLELGHLGICVLGPISLIKGGRSAVAGGIFWVVLGLLVPFAIYIKIAFFTDLKDLFKTPLVDQFSAFYGAFNTKQSLATKLSILPYAYRIVFGLFVGFLVTTSPYGQLVPVLLLNIGFAVLYILYSQLFSDYLQRYLEIFLAIINLVSYSILFGFGEGVGSGAANARTVAFLVIQFIGATACVAFYIISWLQMKEIYSISQCWRCCTCKKK